MLWPGAGAEETHADLVREPCCRDPHARTMDLKGPFNVFPREPTYDLQVFVEVTVVVVVDEIEPSDAGIECGR